jgi:hypothetical protein
MMDAFASVLEPLEAAGVRYEALWHKTALAPWRNLMGSLANKSYAEQLQDKSRFAGLYLHHRSIRVLFASGDSDPEPTNFDIHYTAWEATDLEMLALFLSALTRVYSTTLVLDSHQDLPNNIEMKIYEVFRDTKELCLYGHSAKSILAAMAHDGHERSDTSMTLPFPRFEGAFYTQR